MASMTPVPQLTSMPDPLEQYQRIVALKTLLQQQQYQQQQQPLELEQRRNILQQQQYELGRQQAINSALKQAYTVDSSGQPQLDVSKATQILSNAGYGEASTGIIDAHSKMLQGLATLKETQGKVADQERDTAGWLGYTAQQAGYDPGVMMHGLEQIQPQYPNEVGPLIQRLQQNPTADTVRAIADPLISNSPKVQQMLTEQTAAAARKQAAETGAQRLTLETPKLTAEAALAQQQGAVGQLQADARNQWLQAHPDKNVNDYRNLIAGQKKAAEEAGAFPYQARLAAIREQINNAFWNNKDAINDVETKYLLPYNQKMASVNELKSAVQLASQGNVAAARGTVLKLMGVSNPDGTKRYNEAEARNMMRMGSVPDRFQGTVLDLLTGNSWTPKMAADINSFADAQGQVAQNSLNSGIDSVNTLHGTKIGQGLKGGGGGTGGPPAGATMKVPGSDGRMHWSDGKRDLGVVPAGQ